MEINLFSVNRIKLQLNFIRSHVWKYVGPRVRRTAVGGIVRLQVLRDIVNSDTETESLSDHFRSSEWQIRKRRGDRDGCRRQEPDTQPGECCIGVIVVVLLQKPLMISPSRTNQSANHLCVPA